MGACERFQPTTDTVQAEEGRKEERVREANLAAIEPSSPAGKDYGESVLSGCQQQNQNMKRERCTDGYEDEK